MNIIRTERLAIGYDQKAIMDNINLQALKGQVVCLLGPNGSGKTTMLRTMAGLLAPVEGTVYLNEKDLTTFGGAELAKNVAVLLTERVSVPLLSVFEIVAMGRYPYTGYANRLTPKDIDKVWKALELVNGVSLAQKYFMELSDGEKQKALLARALTQEPELLILDEPTSFLDMRHRYEIIDVFMRLAHEKGTTIILSLHDIELAARCCDIAILLKDNRILGCGPPEQFLTEEALQNLYDFEGVNYNELLGVTELSNQLSPSVFIIGGNGCGVKLYRLLSRYHYGICSGVIHENDVDYQVGKSLGIEMITAKAFEMIDDQTIQKAKARVAQTRQLIDAGFPMGLVNKRNMELIQAGLAMGKTIITLRNFEENCRLFGSMAEKMNYCQCFSSVLEMLAQ
jgi:ABC-type cobalamin/Fe3+-siderophores transport systems, ATPase components